MAYQGVALSCLPYAFEARRISRYGQNRLRAFKTQKVRRFTVNSLIFNQITKKGGEAVANPAFLSARAISGDRNRNPSWKDSHHGKRFERGAIRNPRS